MELESLSLRGHRICYWTLPQVSRTLAVTSNPQSVYLFCWSSYLLLDSSPRVATHLAVTSNPQSVYLFCWSTPVYLFLLLDSSSPRVAHTSRVYGYPYFFCWILLHMFRTHLWVYGHHTEGYPDTDHRISSAGIFSTCCAHLYGHHTEGYPISPAGFFSTCCAHHSPLGSMVTIPRDTPISSAGFFSTCCAHI
jgi:hypothetical protein